MLIIACTNPHSLSAFHSVYILISKSTFYVSEKVAVKDLIAVHMVEGCAGRGGGTALVRKSYYNQERTEPF